MSSARQLRFHQLVRLVQGPVQTAIIDLLKGNFFQVSNDAMQAFHEGRYEAVLELIEAATAEELLIELSPGTWLPVIGEDKRQTWLRTYKEEELTLEVHAEEESSLHQVLGMLGQHRISQVVYYGGDLKRPLPDHLPLSRREKDLARCRRRAHIDGSFEQISESIYDFNRRYNSCWGLKLTVTGDRLVRPCLHSCIALGSIDCDPIDTLLERLQEHWAITKDRVERCRDCELRFVCFDCRELAWRHGGSLTAAPPFCCYDPYRGTWGEPSPVSSGAPEPAAVVVTS